VLRTLCLSASGWCGRVVLLDDKLLNEVLLLENEGDHLLEVCLFFD
jgi:hypothetical protein